MAEWASAPTLWLILAVATVTYMTRIGGHVVLSRFSRIHPRVEAALAAVPAAVITTLVVPPALSQGAAEMITLVAAAAASFRLSPMLVLVGGLVFLVGLRSVGL